MVDHIPEIVLILTSSIAAMAAYVARLHRIHAREVMAINERYQEAISAVQEARVEEMRSVTEAAIALKDVAEGLQKALAQLEYVERQRVRPR